MLPERMYTYQYRSWDGYQKPVISIAILADKNRTWRPSYYQRNFLGCEIKMHYLVSKMLDFAARREELETMDNPFALVILTQLAVLETPKNPHALFLKKLSLIRQLYQKNFQKNDTIQLLIFIDWIIVLPDSLMLEYENEVQQLEEERQMAYITTFERLGIQRGLQQGLEQGVLKGLEQGLERGIRKGLQQGVLKGAKEALIRQLKRRFAQISKADLHKIECADLTTILAWEESVAHSTSVEDVLNSARGSG